MAMSGQLCVDVLTVGLTYRDLIFTGVEALPRPGEERYAQDLHEMWGGIATMARVCGALGMSTALGTAVGSDDASTRLLDDMAAAGINTSLTRRHDGWRLPVTAAMSLPGDRAMLTVEDPLPVDVAAHLDGADLRAGSIIVDLRDPAAPWLQRARAQGSTVFASRGFDPTEQWGDDALAGLGGTDVWMLNDLEAKAFTGLDDPLAAARQLAQRVPLVVVTRGPAGMVAADATTGETASTAAFPVTPRSTTGAGDSTLAALCFARSRPGATLGEHLMLAAFIASAVLASPGGAATPPTIDELIALAAHGEDPRLPHVRALLGRG